MLGDNRPTTLPRRMSSPEMFEFVRTTHEQSSSETTNVELRIPSPVIFERRRKRSVLDEEPWPLEETATSQEQSTVQVNSDTSHTPSDTWRLHLESGDIRDGSPDPWAGFPTNERVIFFAHAWSRS